MSPTDDLNPLVDSLLERLLDLPPEQRAAALEEARQRRPDVAAEAEAILRAAEAEEAFVGEMAGFDVAELLPPDEGTDAELREGHVFADHVVEKKLGRGGVGVVYLARDVLLNRQVALKMLRPERDGADDLDGLRAEARRMAQLEHPNLAAIYHLGEVNDRLFLVMRYYPNGSLADALGAAGGWPGPGRDRTHRAAELLVPVAQAVHYLHQLEPPIIHLDLKPGNILLDGAGQPYVADFGLARALPRPTVPQEQPAQDGGRGADSGGTDVTGTLTVPAQAGHGERFAGTVLYAAPEQACPLVPDAASPGPIGPASDLYALGVILYEMLANRLPLAVSEGLTPPQSRRDYAARILTETPAPLPAHVDEDLQAICLKCLHKEPARRYRTAAALADDLRRWLAGEETSVRPWSFGRRTRHFANRNRTGTVLAAATVLLLFVAVALVGWFAFRSERESRRATASDLKAATDRERLTQSEKEAAEEKAKIKQQAADERAQREHDQLWEERLARARATARRGDWRNALPIYEAVLADVPAGRDALGIQVERLPGLFLAFDRPALEAELARLAARADLSEPDRARVRLLQGDLLFSAYGQADAGRALVRQARASGQLREPDRAYADALLADGPAEATRLFRALLDIDPFYPRAHACLALLLVLRGEHDEALQELTFARRLTPDDPTLEVIAAWHELFGRGDRAAALACLDRVRQRVGEERWKVMRAFLTELADLQELLRQVAADQRPPDVVGQVKGFVGNSIAVLRIGIAVGHLLGVATRLRDSFSFNVPTAAWAYEMCTSAYEAYVVSLRQDVATAAQRLAPLAERYPSADLLFLLGVWQLQAAAAEKGIGEQKKQAATAMRTFYRAAAAPALLGSSDWPARARTVALVLDGALEREPDGADPERSERYRRHLPLALVEGHTFPALRTGSHPMLAQVLPAQQGRAVLQVWLADEPGSAVAWRELVKLELREGHAVQARQLADERLVWWRRDPEMRRLRREADAALVLRP